jgi:undecaprenyl diphosphate synthase
MNIVNQLLSIKYMPIKKVIGFIMDGNRRWAIKNDTSLSISYTKGAEIFCMTIIECIQYQISTIVFYALSFDNFDKRNKDELTIIYNVGITELYNRKKFFIENKIKIIFVGNKSVCEEKILHSINDLERETHTNNPIITVFILFIYDPYKDVFGHALDKYNKELFYSKDIPNIDLIIRTGGYNRLSGFLPIQSMNATIVFLNELWPDLTKKKLCSILSSYKDNRNYGR